MSILKNNNKKDDLILYVAFHFSDEKLMREVLEELETAMSDTFGESQALERCFLEEREILYRLSITQEMSKSELKEFFNKIDATFKNFDQYTPHFTQYHSESGNII